MPFAPTGRRPGRRCPASETAGRCWGTQTARSRSTHVMGGRARSRSIRDAILHALAQDETLEPRDVIVMCPDIENFAPLIQATFGVAETVVPLDGDDTELARAADPTAAQTPRQTDLRVRLADRSLRQTNPVLGCRLAAARALPAAPDRLAGARSRRSRAGPPPLRAARRRSDPAAGLDRRGGYPLGLGRAAPCSLQARTDRERDLADGPAAAAARRHDDRRRAAAV